MHDLRRILEAGSRLGSAPAALATIVRTRGSTYRRAGTRMLITADGETIGAVSGGCLEAEIAERAISVVTNGEACLICFDTHLAYGCQGEVEVLIERVCSADPHADLLGCVARHMAARQACVVATVFSADGTVRLGSSIILPNEKGGALPWEAYEDGKIALAEGCSTSRSYAWGECFFDVIHPPIRLVIAGAGHDVVPLVRLSRALGWEVRVAIHPMEAHRAELLGATVECDVVSPPALAADLRPDPFTAVVVMTHHFGRDLAFLDAMLPLPLPYLGLLGPRKRREQLLAELADRRGALDPAILSKLRNPIGLDLGAESPEEIALSIVAEIQATLADRSGRPLRECKGPIHADRGAPARPHSTQIPA